MPALRIGVNALYLIPGGVGGTEIYLRCLLSELARIDSLNRYFVFTNRETGPDLVPPSSNFEYVPQPVRGVFRPGRILWEQTALPAAVRRRGLDVLLNPGFTSPVLCPCPAVTVFHDLQHKRHPEYFRWFDLLFWRMLLYLSARRSDLLLADSEATHDDLLRFYRMPAGKVRVAPLGVDDRFFEIGRRREPDRERPYLLAVSTLHPHKNFDRLIRAFSEFKKQKPEFTLVITGVRGFHAEAIERLIEALDLRESVRLTGWVPREELYELFRRAYAFLYPTTFEGFGLPVVEALAAGIPAGCSSVEPVKSIAGDAALQFDPKNEDEIREAMLRLTSDEDLRRALSERGPRRAAEFSWRTTAEITLAALIDAAGYRSRSSS